MIYLGVYFFLGRPIFFYQKRAGLHGKPFNVLKFRTMNFNKDDEGNLLPDSERLNFFGKFLRNFSLDELPQLINIFNGKMSFVGPRPLPMEYLRFYSKEQNIRHDIRPGLSGWMQINGRNSISWEKKFILDIWYVKNRSFFLDLKILLTTIIKVFNRDGINASSSETMPKFRG
tara:strand:- start:8235 stop:8753 length:519 start_codon:yes stop_codon:yes gene_type:complete